MTTVYIDPQPVLNVEETCPVCSMKFWIPATVYEWSRRMKGQATYCPVGHSWVSSSPDPDYRVGKPKATLRFMEVVTEPTPRPPEPIATTPIADGANRRMKKKKVQCDICSKWFVNNGGLKQHMIRAHKDVPD